MFKKFLVFLMVFFGLISSTVTTAFANGAKMSDLPVNNGSFVFDENPNISLIEESVTFDVSYYGDHGSPADVTVRYKLKNLSEDYRDIIMLFVAPFMGVKVPVKVNGTDITDLCKINQNVPLPDNWMPIYNYTLVDPVSKKNLLMSNNPPEYKDKTFGLEVPVSLSPLGITDLEIKYSCGSGYETQGVYNSVSGFVYYLTPARFWTGDAKVNLFVNLPNDGKYDFYSNVSMEKASENSYRTTMDKLPNYEWNFSFFRESALNFGTNDRGRQTTYLFSIALAIYLIPFLLSLLTKRNLLRSFIRLLGYIMSVIFFVKVYHSNIYGLAASSNIFLLFILGGVVPVIWLLNLVIKGIRFIINHNKQAE